MRFSLSLPLTDSGISVGVCVTCPLFGPVSPLITSQSEHQYSAGPVLSTWSHFCTNHSPTSRQPARRKRPKFGHTHLPNPARSKLLPLQLCNPSVPSDDDGPAIVVYTRHSRRPLPRQPSCTLDYVIRQSDVSTSMLTHLSP